ncbi:MAG: glycoside hydrolase family 57 protein [Gammaproteobacteria bacterium]
MTPARLPVVLLWHMHQPEYRVDGVWQLPWTYLHALKGYTDMAAHIEAQDGACAVFNFTPVLLEQLRDYAQYLRAAVTDDRPIPDPLLDGLRALPPAGAARTLALVLAARADPGPVAQRDPRWRSAAARIGAMAQPGLLADAEARDFLVQTHLVWLGESVRTDARAKALIERGQDYAVQDARALLALIADVLGGLLQHYRRLWEQGRIELSVTPYQHPIVPLLLDFRAAEESAPGVVLPSPPYPGGEARARWHIAQGLQIFESLFGRRPAGCWPAEAALSEETLALLAESGFRWTASSASVLRATGQHHGVMNAHPHRAYRSNGHATLCLFRDDGLSDRLGFVYQHWQVQDALQDLLRHAVQIAATGPDRELLLIALDGENPWGWYPDNGIHFVRGLYRALAEHPRLRPALPAALLDTGLAAEPLPRLQAGSWVSGQLLTWIGHPEEPGMAAADRGQAALRCRRSAGAGNGASAWRLRCLRLVLVAR